MRVIYIISIIIILFSCQTGFEGKNNKISIGGFEELNNISNNNGSDKFISESSENEQYEYNDDGEIDLEYLYDLIEIPKGNNIRILGMFENRIIFIDHIAIGQTNTHDRNKFLVEIFSLDLVEDKITLVNEVEALSRSTKINSPGIRLSGKYVVIGRCPDDEKIAIIDLLDSSIKYMDNKFGYLRLGRVRTSPNGRFIGIANSFSGNYEIMIFDIETNEIRFKYRYKKIYDPQEFVIFDNITIIKENEYVSNGMKSTLTFWDNKIGIPFKTIEYDELGTMIENVKNEMIPLFHRWTHEISLIGIDGTIVEKRVLYITDFTDNELDKRTFNSLLYKIVFNKDMNRYIYPIKIKDGILRINNIDRDSEYFDIRTNVGNDFRILKLDTDTNKIICESKGYIWIWDFTKNMGIYKLNRADFEIERSNIIDSGIVSEIISKYSFFKHDQNRKILSVQMVSTNLPMNEANRIITQVERAIINKNLGTLVVQNDKDIVIEYMKNYLTGMYNENIEVKIGELLFADHIIMLNLLYLNGKYNLNIKVVEMNNGEIIRSEIYSSYDFDELLNIINNKMQYILIF